MLKTLLLLAIVSPETFLEKRVCVTDTVRFTAASGCISCVDPEHAPEPLTSAPLKAYLGERGMKGFDILYL